METKDLLELIGYQAPEEGEIKLEDVRSYVNSTFVPVEQLSSRNDLIDPIISKAVGSKLGKLETNYIKELKSMGVEVTHSEFKDQGVEGLINGGLEKVKSLIAEKSKGGKPNEELEAKLESLTKERDTFQKSVEEWQGKYNGLEESISNEKETAIKTGALDSAFNKIKYPSTATEVAKKGLKSMFLDNYDLENDNGTVYVLHRSGENKGSRVQHPKNAAKLMTTDDAVEFFAKDNDMWSESPHDGKPTRKPEVSSPTRDVDNPARKVRQASPGFLNAGMG